MSICYSGSTRLANLYMPLANNRSQPAHAGPSESVRPLQSSQGVFPPDTPLRPTQVHAELPIGAHRIALVTSARLSLSPAQYDDRSHHLHPPLRILRDLASKPVSSLTCMSISLILRSNRSQMSVPSS
jgi:hypothetical protein